MYKCNNCNFRTEYKHVLKVHVEYEKKELTEEFLKYCWENKLDKVSDCLSRGVDVNTVSEDGCWTGLHIACYKGYVELLNLLLEEPNLDVNKTVRVCPKVLARRAAAELLSRMVRSTN